MPLVMLAVGVIIALFVGMFGYFFFTELFGEVSKERREIAARADSQHAAALRGDPYGLYGDYPPEQVGDPAAIEPARKAAPVKDWEYRMVNGQRVMFIRRNTVLDLSD